MKYMSNSLRGCCGQGQGQFTIYFLTFQNDCHFCDKVAVRVLVTFCEKVFVVAVDKCECKCHSIVFVVTASVILVVHVILIIIEAVEINSGNENLHLNMYYEFFFVYM